MKKLADNSLKKLDLFAQPISITFKGESSYRTPIGGITSILLGTLMIAFLSVKMTSLINREGSTVRKDTLISVSNQDSPAYKIGEGGNSFTFAVSDTGGNTKAFDKKYGTLRVRQTKLEIAMNPDGTLARKRKKTVYYPPYSKCSIDHPALAWMDKEDLVGLPILDYNCIDWQNHTLQGNFYAPNWQYMNLDFIRCVGQPYCANDTEFFNWFKDTQVQVAFLGSFFDSTNYEKPIKYFLEDGYYVLGPNQNMQVSLYVKRGEVTLEDDAWSIFGSQETKTFFAQSSLVQSYKPVADDQEYLSIRITLDKNFDIYHRQVYTIGMVFTDIGGFYTVFFAICSVLMSSLTQTSFLASLVTRLFAINKKINEPGIGIGQTISIRKSTKSIFGAKYQLETADQSQGDQIDVDLIEEFAKDRTRLRIGLADIIMMINGAFCCKRFKRMPKTRILEKGTKKIFEDLDIVSILRKLRFLENFASCVLTSHQKTLLSHQKKDILNIEEASSDDDRLSISKSNGKATKEEGGDLKYAFAHYRGKRISKIDRRILYGILSTKPFPEDGGKMFEGEKTINLSAIIDDASGYRTIDQSSKIIDESKAEIFIEFIVEQTALQLKIIYNYIRQQMPRIS